MAVLANPHAVELLKQLGLAPSADRVQTILEWARSHNEQLQQHADKQQWLVEQYEALVDTIVGEGGVVRPALDEVSPPSAPADR